MQVTIREKKPRTSGAFFLFVLKLDQEPVTNERVTVPIVMLLITTLPLGLMMTGRTRLEDSRVPSTKETLRELDEPFAAPPDVATLSVQGLIVMTRPLAKGELAGKVEAVMVNMQEPKVVTPVAVAPPDEMLKVGEAAVLVKATVVAAVVPKAGTPLAKLMGWLTIEAAVAAPVAGVSSAETLEVVVIEEKVGELLLPPPQAASVAVRITAKPNFESFSMRTISLTRLLQN
jgi:hypothetical protein